MDLRGHWERSGDDPIHRSLGQRSMRLFSTADGCIGWVRAGGRVLSLGPPLAPPGSRPALWRAFLSAVPSAEPHYLRAGDALELQRVAPEKFFFTSIGAERFVDLRAPVGASAAARAAQRKALRAGFSLREVAWASLAPAHLRALDALTQSFVARGQYPVELRFVNRPLVTTGDDPGRLFLLARRDAVFGYAVLDRYRCARGDGYLLNMVRFERTKLWGVYLATVCLLAERLASEGAAQLSLGLSPLADRAHDARLRSSRTLEAQVRLLAAHRDRLYDFRALEHMKLQFASEPVQRLAALRSRSLPGALVRLALAHGVGPAMLLSAGKRPAREAPLVAWPAPEVSSSAAQAP